jgi:hypothetical protein
LSRVRDNEPDLFAPHTRARVTDPGTSFAAARQVAPKMTALRRVVLLHFARLRTMTDLDLESLCSDHGSTYRTRRSELAAMGYIADSGERRMQRGSNRVLWTITPDGITAAKVLC